MWAGPVNIVKTRRLVDHRRRAWLITGVEVATPKTPTLLPHASHGEPYRSLEMKKRLRFQSEAPLQCISRVMTDRTTGRRHSVPGTAAQLALVHRWSPVSATA